MRLLIKELLASRNMGQNDLAALMGKSQAAISLQINGTPTLKSIAEMADALQVPMSDLFEVPEGYVHWTQRERHEAELTAKKAESSLQSRVFHCPACGMELQILKEGE